MVMGMAELVFVEGPQEGQRTLLTSSTMVAGRSPQSDLTLDEPYVSRRQFQFTNTTEGWVVENISDTPIRINGKKYKRGKKILLDTGDVISVGMATEILFVSGSDQAQQAMDEYRLANPEGEPEPAEKPAVKTPKPKRTEKSRKSKPPEPKTDRSDKLQKYAVMFTIYLVVIVAGAIFLKMHLSTRSKTSTDAPGRLTLPQIERILKAPVGTKIMVKDLLAANNALEQARQTYHDAAVKDGNLYKSVKYFKLYLAYKRGTFEERRDEQMFRLATSELVDKVQHKYRNAVIHEKDKNWLQARMLFEELLRIVPAKDKPHPEPDNAIFDNIKEHFVYVRNQARKVKK